MGGGESPGGGGRVSERGCAGVWIPISDCSIELGWDGLVRHRIGWLVDVQARVGAVGSDKSVL